MERVLLLILMLTGKRKKTASYLFISTCYVVGFTDGVMENKLDFDWFFKHSYARIFIWMSIHIVLKGMCTKKKLKGKN